MTSPLPAAGPLAEFHGKFLSSGSRRGQDIAARKWDLVNILTNVKAEISKAKSVAAKLV